MSNPVLVGGTLYGLSQRASGQLFALDARSGKVLWLGTPREATNTALIKSGDLLFLPMHDLPEGRRARIVPGKTYEYLAARRPILAAVPDGDVRGLMREAGNADVVRPKDVGGMAATIERHADRVLAGEPPPEPNEELLRRHERRELTARLAEVFDGLAGPG